MNTHLFDGKITELISHIKDLDENPLDENIIKEYLADRPASKIFKTLINDISLPANNDNLNNINVVSLLNKCGNLWENPDFRFVFEEQLNDMISGMCAQGRCIRLAQIIGAFTEWK